MSTRTHITDAEDPRVGEYLALNDPIGRRRVERRGGYFVVEGLVALERLLATPGWEIRSLLLLPRAADRLADRLTDVTAPVLIADEAVLEQVVGFPIHRGALGAVTRIAPPRLDANVLTDLLERAHHEGGERVRMLALESINDHENMGALYRNAAGLGAAAVLLDDRCADPFYRRSVRVSSGLVLSVPTFRIGAVADVAPLLRAEGVTVAALTSGGDTDLAGLARRLDPHRAVTLLVGAEGPGLTVEAIDSADHRVSIAMAGDVDSLNVATAAAIALHHLR